jgi:pyridoxamine 5'-phosphate oxidase
MNKNEILEFISKNPSCSLATCEGNKPHARGMLTYSANDDGILFHTGKTKDLHKQLMKNPNVELCFGSGKIENFIQVRISGKAELDEDIGLKKEIVHKREFLKPMVEREGYDFLAVYRIRKGVATVWTMQTNLAPKSFVQL